MMTNGNRDVRGTTPAKWLTRERNIVVKLDGANRLNWLKALL